VPPPSCRCCSPHLVEGDDRTRRDRGHLRRPVQRHRDHLPEHPAAAGSGGKEGILGFLRGPDLPRALHVPLGLLTIIIVSKIDGQLPKNVDEIWMRIHATAHERHEKQMEPTRSGRCSARPSSRARLPGPTPEGPGAAEAPVPHSRHRRLFRALLEAGRHDVGGEVSTLSTSEAGRSRRSTRLPCRASVSRSPSACARCSAARP